MAKRQYFLIINTVSTIEGTVADFGAVVCDTKGKVYKSIGVLVAGEYDVKELFYDENACGYWGVTELDKRKENYRRMLETGLRQLATVGGINRWLESARCAYHPELISWDLAFDLEKCRNTEINLSSYEQHYCLRHIAEAYFAEAKAFKSFILQSNAVNPPASFESMPYRRSAAVMAAFVQHKTIEEESHTSFEDVFFELPIFLAIVKKPKWREKFKAVRGYQ